MVLALFIAAGFLIFFPALKAGTVFDDFQGLVQNQAIRSIDIPKFFIDPTSFSAKPGNWPYRPIVVLSYALDYRLGGGNWSTFHATNILLHSLVGFWIYLVTAALFKKRTAGMIGGLLFIAHPLPGFSACYLSARSGILSGLFLLISLYFWVRWSQNQEGRMRTANFLFSILAFLLALFSKIDALSFVFVAGCLLFFSPKSKREKIEAGMLFLAVALSFFAFEKIVSHSTSRVTKSVLLPTYSRMESILAGISAPWIYLEKIAIPGNITIFPALPEPGWLLLFLSVLGYISVCYALFLHKNLKFWLVMVWYFSALVPAALLHLNILLSWYRGYLGLIGLFLGLGLAGEFLIAKSRKAGIAFIIVFGLFAATVSNHQSRVWQNPVEVWSRAVKAAPREFAPHHFLGTRLINEGELVQAERELKIAIQLQPDFFPDSYNSLGSVYYLKAEFRGAEKAFQKAWERDPQNYVYLENLMITQLKLQKADAVHARLPDLIRLAPPGDPKVEQIINGYNRLRDRLSAN